MPFKRRVWMDRAANLWMQCDSRMAGHPLTIFGMTSGLLIYMAMPIR